MRILEKCKDGGKDSPVDAYFLIEIKSLFSIAILKFNKGSREEFHTHAFDALTWFIKGDIIEEGMLEVSGAFWPKYTPYKRSLLPKVTTKDNLHRVIAHEDSWCLTIRGKWQDTWTEYNQNTVTTTTLTHNRVVVKKETKVVTLMR